MSRIIKFEVVIHGESKIVDTLTEAEKLISRTDYSDFEPCYILRKEYSRQGNLLDTYIIF